MGFIFDDDDVYDLFVCELRKGTEYARVCFIFESFSLTRAGGSSLFFIFFFMFCLEKYFIVYAETML